jgi:hypothetical protein
MWRFPLWMRTQQVSTNLSKRLAGFNYSVAFAAIERCDLSGTDRMPKSDCQARW